jgi:tRNA/rRNA methyltransferase
MEQNILMKKFSIVLCRPRFPENIGAAARAARNMGIGKLIVVRPENLDRERILMMATHNAAPLIEGMDVYDSLDEALAPFGYIVGTTARTGGVRGPIFTPREMASEVFRYASENDVALVFGSEDRGLTNEDIRFCHQLVKIPTAEFSSLNLAQAVMILCYEIYLASFEPPHKVSPRLASSQELERMYEKVKEILIKVSFIRPENPEHWMMNIRRFCSRITLRSSDVNLIMGMCRQVNWYGKNCHEQGRDEGLNMKRDENRKQ